MADHILSSIERRPEAVHVVLTGNLHSRTTRGNRFDPEYEPMGHLVRR